MQMVPPSQPASWPCRHLSGHSAPLQPASWRWRNSAVPQQQPLPLQSNTMYLPAGSRPGLQPSCSTSCTHGSYFVDAVCKRHQWCRSLKRAISGDRGCSTSYYSGIDDQCRRTGAILAFAVPESASKRGQPVDAITSGATCLPVEERYADEQDFVKAGGNELDLVQLQASKAMEQPNITDKLEPLLPGDELLHLVVIGCGPAGLSLAAEAAKQGLNVGLIGPDLPFVNNYGVWEDEFAALGLENCIEETWKDSAMYFESEEPLMIGRAYGRVSRHLLREELLKRCADAGVRYLDSAVEEIIDTDEHASTVVCATGRRVNCRLVTVASGAAAGRFLQYEAGGPGVSVQTAYGIEVEVENYPYSPDIMLFMDYRSHVVGTDNGPWGKIPTFLYAMPLSSTKVFFEETCLAARPSVPFEVLKERLHSRLQKMGMKVKHLYEEEWSYIPVGGTLPDTKQQHLGFGAAASMVHPATGYSVVRSLSEAPHYAAAIASALRIGGNSKGAALEAWNALWPMERKRQRAFFLFGLELILQMDKQGMTEFFETFFKLPDWLWRGFLACNLSSVEILWFAFVTFLVASNALRYRLIRHLMVDPSGSSLIRVYTGLEDVKLAPFLFGWPELRNGRI